MSNLSNAYWWMYYWRADTLYQVHSPFLYDFAANVLPGLPRALFQSNGKWFSGNLTYDQGVLLSWLLSFSTYYQIDDLVLPIDNHVSDFLIRQRAIKPVPPRNPIINSLSIYRFQNTNNPLSSGFMRTVFQAAAILPVDLINSKMVDLMPCRYDSFVMIVTHIHKDRFSFAWWKDLITSGTFHFSIELYNFGILFYHPVNRRPEHKTLISWFWKPWKIKTL